MNESEQVKLGTRLLKFRRDRAHDPNTSNGNKFEQKRQQQGTNQSTVRTP